MSQNKSKYLPLVYFVGVMFLGVIAILSFVSPDQSAQTERLGASIESLAIAVAQLDSKVDRLGDSISDKGNPGMEVIGRSSLENSTVEELVQLLARFERTLNALTDPLGGRTSTTASASGNEAMYFVETYPAKTSVLMNLKSQSNHDLSVGFLGWGYRQILGEFGSPTDTNNRDDGSVSFYYGDLPNGGNVWMYFVGGQVVKVESSWD